MHTDIDIVIGEPVIHTNPTDCFVLTVTYEHGDADGESEKTFTYPNTEEGVGELKFDLLSLDAVEDMNDYRDELTALYTALGVENVDECIEMFSRAFYTGDHTNDYSSAAQYGGYDLVYYDENGVEYNVNTNYKEAV